MSDQAVTVRRVLPATAQAELAVAAARLRTGGGMLFRMADLMGGAMGRSVRLGARTLGLAPDIESKVRDLAGLALRRAFDIAVVRLKDETTPNPAVTRAVVIASGAVGGFLGMGGFLPDVSVTTLVIMRSIARIAQEEGEDLADEETRRACLQVFALAPGGDTTTESDFGYFSARLMAQGRPIVFMIGEVAGRYGLSLSQKLALQAVPIVGAVSGAALNNAFLGHYREAARAHFVVRRLERAFGVEEVRRAWEDVNSN